MLLMIFDELLMDIIVVLFLSKVILLIDPSPLFEIFTCVSLLELLEIDMREELTESFLMVFVEMMFPVMIDTFPVLLSAELFPVFAVSVMEFIILAF